MSNTDDLVTTWKLDAKDLNKQLVNVKAGFDMLWGGMKALGGAFDDITTRGAEFARIQTANTLSIREAALATKGLVSNMELMKAANAATSFGLGLTSAEFAKLSKSAVVMSQILGIDANKAIGDLTLGMARQSKVILDNLGLMINAESANREYAKSINKTVAQLSDADKKAAFMNATMDELNSMTEMATIKTDDLGTKMDQLKIAADNAKTGFGLFLGVLLSGSSGMGGLAATLNDVADAMNRINPHRERQMGITSRLVEISKEIQLKEKGLGSATGLPNIAEPGMPAFMSGGGRGGASSHWAVTKKELKALYAEQERLNQQLSKNRVDAELEGNMKIINASFLETKRIVAQTLSTKPGKGGRKKRGGGSWIEAPGVGLNYEKTRDVEPVMEEWDKELAESRKRVAKITGDADLIRKTQAEKDAATAAERHTKAIERQYMPIQKANKALTELAAGGLADMAGGMWAAADAAIQGTESFGAAMAKMLKQTLLSIATEATIKGMMQMAEYVASWGMNPKALTAAGMYFAVAALAGAGGLATSAAIGSSGGSSSGSAGGSSSSSGRDYSSSFSGTKSTKSQPINVNLYLGDPGDPSAALMLQKQLKVQMAKAA